MEQKRQVRKIYLHSPIADLPDGGTSIVGTLELVVNRIGALPERAILAIGHALKGAGFSPYIESPNGQGYCF